MTAADLKAFEAEVAELFAAGKIRGPVHLSGGNAEQLLDIFADIDREDWVFSTYRSHFHALLHGIDREWLMSEILAGRSMNIMNPEHRFFTSAIVGGCLPIAVGVAEAIKRRDGLEQVRKVWCFLGDMAASTGAFHEALQYAEGHRLPIEFLIEDNGMSCNSPTAECWGIPKAFKAPRFLRYSYERVFPHVGTGAWIKF